jgi:VacB/RNase II family 3'-5' exoribonuclease
METRSMANRNGKGHRSILQRIARQAMRERGLLPEFSAEAISELDGIRLPAPCGESMLRDLRTLLWCSIDNDDSRDLDQLSVAESLSGGGAKILVAISDVDALVNRGTPIDDHARHNTTSVYTAGGIFPMLPEKLSTDLTSLNHSEDRCALVVEMVITDDGSLGSSDIYGAIVRNQAKLAYNGVAAWLEGSGPIPEGVSSVDGLADNLRLQDRTAQKMKRKRHEHGALNLETIKARPVFQAEDLVDLEVDQRNRAKEIIEDFMIGANGVTARYLAARKFPSVRRVVRTPKRWDRIVELASESGAELPGEPDSRALEMFLLEAREKDPLRFPDLSLSIIKLMGAGEYTVEFPGEKTEGHFGLAVRDYTHSTAPNRRYPDLVTQRLLKAAMSGKPVPYGREELGELGAHCTKEEDAAKKVERQVEKSAAALLMESRIGEKFDAIVTGAADKGTWVRLFHPPIEGKLVLGFEGVDVGYKLRVQLVDANVERGFIDFKRTN